MRNSHPCFRLLPEAAKCLSTVVWGYSSRSIEHRFVERESCLIGCSQMSISALDLLRSLTLYFLLRKRSNRSRAVWIDISLSLIVLHIWFVGSVTFWSKPNSWGKSPKTSIRRMLISTRLHASISIDIRSFERLSHTLFTPLISRLG